MIALDTNILVYAHRSDSPWHKPAKAALRSLVGCGEPWGVAWPCIHEFIAVVTNPRLYQPSTSLEGALRQLDNWMESPTLRLLGEGPGYWERLRVVALSGQIVGAMIHDAHVAAICLEHGVSELWTADRDFSRMRGLRVRNPLL